LGEDPKQGQIACPDSDTRISIERVQTAYASDSCDNSTCPFSISSSHVYYKHINATCGNRASCTIDAQQLADNFSNSFRYCNSGGNSRNVVTILFSCISGISIVCCMFIGINYKLEPHINWGLVACLFLLQQRGLLQALKSSSVLSFCHKQSSPFKCLMAIHVYP